MNTARAHHVILLAIAASLWWPTTVRASNGTGNSTYTYDIGNLTKIEDVLPYSADNAGFYFFDTFYFLVSAIGNAGEFGVTVTGNGDPLLEYELTLENTGTEPIDMFFTATIDIDPIMAGLPTTSTLEVEILDPGGEGINSSMFHRGFLQGVDVDFPQTGLDDLAVQINSAGVHSIQSSSLVPDPFPFEGDSYDRLHVATNFVVEAGDTYIVRGNTTIFVPEPSTFTLLLGALLIGVLGTAARNLP